MADVRQTTDPSQVNHAAAWAFVMLNADIREPDPEEPGYYDPETQMWIGGNRLGLGTGSTRQNPATKVWSYQTDD